MKTINIDNMKLQYLNGKYYILKSMHGNGIFKKILTDIEERENKKVETNRSEFKLYQNCPNPFYKVTGIQFSIPKSALVKLSIFDISGSEVEILLDEFRLGGIHNIQFDGSNLSKGSYFCKLTCKSATEDFSDLRKMILLKR